MRAEVVHVKLGVAACCILIACASDSASTVMSDDLPGQAQVTVGMDESSAWFSRVVTGRFLGSDTLVIVDRAAPYVRHYDAQGAELVRYIGRGSGPGEARVPLSVAATPNGLVIVADGTRLQVFTAAGHLKFSHSLPSVPVALASGCEPDEIAVYGPGNEANGRFEWLVLYSVSDSAIWKKRVLFSDTVRSPRGGYGKNVLSSDRSSISFMHEYGVRPSVLRYRCADNEMRQVNVLGLQQRQADGGGAVVGPGTGVFGGIANLNEGVAWAVSWMPTAPGASGRNELHYWDGESQPILLHRTSTHFVVLDGRDDILLLGLTDPQPAVTVRRIVVSARIRPVRDSGE